MTLSDFMTEAQKQEYKDKVEKWRKAGPPWSFAQLSGDLSALLPAVGSPEFSVDYPPEAAISEEEEQLKPIVFVGGQSEKPDPDSKKTQGVFSGIGDSTDALDQWRKYKLDDGRHQRPNPDPEFLDPNPINPNPVDPKVKAEEWEANKKKLEAWLGQKGMLDDPVNHPQHYGGDTVYETIKVLRAWLSREEFIGFLRGNCIKYYSRYKLKGGNEDLRKAEWYSSYLIRFLEETDKI